MVKDVESTSTPLPLINQTLIRITLIIALPYVPVLTHYNMVSSILRARKVNLAISKSITPPETTRLLPDESPYKGERLSGDNLIPSDGYSSLVRPFLTSWSGLIDSLHLV